VLLVEFFQKNVACEVGNVVLRIAPWKQGRWKRNGGRNNKKKDTRLH